MRFLANENIPAAVVTALRAAGHDVAWVREDAPGAPDDAVLARAVADERVLLTSTRISVSWPGAAACRRPPA